MELIEQLSFEEILSQMKEELVRRDASFTAVVKSDPAIKILEIAAWRELLLIPNFTGNRTNEKEFFVPIIERFKQICNLFHLSSQ